MVNINDPNFRCVVTTALARNLPCSMATLEKALDELAKQGRLDRAKSKSLTGREHLTISETQMAVDQVAANQVCHRDTG